MKHGFALIELIVATLVASMVAAILLSALSQGNRFQMIIDNTIDTSVRIGVIANQLEKDLMGAFIPVQAEKKDQPQKAQEADKSNDAKKDDSKKTPAKKDEPEQKRDEKEIKPIEKIFYSTNKAGKLDTLTFITNNPLVVFVGKDVGVVKPKVVRVQYSLRPEVGNKDSYALFRQESMELDLEKYKDVRAYEVIGGIKDCKITFTARIEKKDDKKAEQGKEKPKIQYEYKTLSEWVSEQPKKDAEKEKAEFPRIPYNVEIKIALWDMQEKRDKEFTIVCQIPVDFSEPKKDDKKKVEEPKKDEQQPVAPADNNKQNTQKVALNKSSKSEETVTYNGIQTHKDNLDSLKKIFGHV